MMGRSMKLVIVALAASLALSGCSTSVGQWFAGPPTGLDQQMGIAVAMKSAKIGCERLATRALKAGEVANLARSLEYVSGLLAENPTINAEKLTRDLAAASPEVAEFAPEILGVTMLAAAMIPQEQREATYYVLVQGVVGQCRVALGTTS